jgi:hypothetical protein
MDRSGWTTTDSSHMNSGNEGYHSSSSNNNSPLGTASDLRAMLRHSDD